MTAWSALEQTARVEHTPCLDGQMVWRVWGAGAPLVLLHGGAGSWLHWLPTIDAFRGERLVVVPDLPGLGDSAGLPPGYPDGGASIVAAGLTSILGSTDVDLAGFSFGGVLSGLIAAEHRIRSLTLVGSGGLGVIRQTAKLERVRDKQGAERDATHRINLQRWMIADAARIDDTAVAIQDWNSRRARFDSRPLGISDALLGALPRVQSRVGGIWGALDHAVQGETDRARDVIRAIHPGAPFVAIPGAGHWVAYEAPDAFAAALRGMLTVTEQRHNEQA